MPAVVRFTFVRPEVYSAADEVDVERAGLTAVEWLALKRRRILSVPATRPQTGERWLAPLHSWELPFAASSQVVIELVAQLVEQRTFNP